MNLLSAITGVELNILYQTKRNGWESQWSEVSDLFLPEHNVTWSLSDIGDVSINTGAVNPLLN
jgi:hypothetical protein